MWYNFQKIEKPIKVASLRLCVYLFIEIVGKMFYQ